MVRKRREARKSTTTPEGTQARDLDVRRQTLARDRRARELTTALREFYPLCERSPHAAELCRLWTRSRHVAANVAVEWEPVGDLPHGRATLGPSDDPSPLLRGLRGLVSMTRGDQPMVTRLLARALHDLAHLWKQEPLAADLCSRWDRCLELGEQLSDAYGVRVSFKDAGQWKVHLAAGCDREQDLEEPWAVSP